MHYKCLEQRSSESSITDFLETSNDLSNDLIGASSFSIVFWVKHAYNISQTKPEIYFSFGGDNSSTNASTLTFGKISLRNILFL